jgi:CRP-like cAMP-binding protein
MTNNSNEEKLVRAAAAGHNHFGSASVSSNTDNKNVFSRLASSIDYPGGVELFQQGSQVKEVYLIEKGLVKLKRVDEDGNELIIGLRSTGSILGAESAIIGKPHAFSAVTLTRCCLRCIPVVTLLALAKGGNDFSWYLHQLHSQEVYDQASQLIGLKYLSARSRLEQLIWQLCNAMELDELNKPLKLQIPLRYKEIAQLLGVTPEHLSRVFKQMEEEKVVFKEDGSWIIADPRRLYHPEDV